MILPIQALAKITDCLKGRARTCIVCDGLFEDLITRNHHPEVNHSVT